MKRIGSVFWFVVCAVFMLSIIPTATSAQEKALKLRYSNFMPAMSPLSKITEAWCKEVEKRTSGRVLVTYFPANTLTPPMQTYDSVVKGIADLGQSLLAYAPGRLPLSEVLSLPLGYTSGYQATKLANAFYKKFRPKEFDDVAVMYLEAGDPGIFHTKKAISSVDDLKGLRIKCNTETAETCKALGVVPLTMPITECYDSLRQGLIEGVFTPTEALKGFRLGELTKYSLENYGSAYAPSIFIIMNKNKWNSISRVDQQAIEQINEEWIEKHALLWNQLANEAKEWAISKGTKWIKASKEEEAKTAEKMKPVFAKYISDMKAKGLPGEEAVKFCQDYIKAHPHP